jgi:hypothetical protein
LVCDDGAQDRRSIGPEFEEVAQGCRDSLASPESSWLTAVIRIPKRIKGLGDLSPPGEQRT